MKQKSLARQLSFGLVDTGVDLLLAGVSLGLNLITNTKRHPKDPVTLLVDSYKLTVVFKKQFLLKTGYYAKKQGWLKKKNGRLALTNSGRDYLSGKIPQYKKYRPWDGRLYLITYDINETRHKWRDHLRRFLVGKGAKMIQKSVWLSVRDLSPVLEKFRQELIDRETILISSLKKGEGVGKERLDILMEKLYGLDDLNRRYFEFIQLAKNKQLKDSERVILKFKYLAVLSDDPQLPRSLLPFTWYGDEAYKYYTKLMLVRAEI